jgi:hypothetical protein
MGFEQRRPAAITILDLEGFEAAAVPRAAP